MSTQRPKRPLPSPGNRLAFHLANTFRNRGFLVCVALLATFTVGFEVLALRKGIQFRKQALPLKKPLKHFNQDKLAPHKLLRPITLQPDMVDQLGTEEYLQWYVAGPHGTAGNVPGHITLFVTYYTGKPDQVPHVPEVCYAASGHRQIADHLIDVDVPALGPGETIPVRVLELQQSGRLLGGNDRIVMYTFHANGRFCRSRRQVQGVIGNPLTKYAYFSKVEISMDIGVGYASKEQAVEAGRRFLQVVVPVLLEDHWPDWDAAVSQTESQSGADDISGVETANR